MYVGPMSRPFATSHHRIVWESIRPGLVKQVEAARSWRHFQEKNALHRRRTDLLQPLYDAYARSLPPRQWAYLPDIQDVALFSLFGDVVTADSSANVTESSFMPAMRALPALIMAKNAVAKVRITSLLGPLSEEVDEPLDLATSVFECDSWCRHRRPSLFSSGERLALMSWEVIVTHASNISTSQFGLAKLKFSTAGSSTAVALVGKPGSIRCARQLWRWMHWTCASSAVIVKAPGRGGRRCQRWGIPGSQRYFVVLRVVCLGS
ncbi:hypothetical protein BD779DRAFT_1170378 [Infundibulicybe gibba]|nr:hypothetical protein BD779DRAFT_1170378 [Infundibulicybe gibba]